LVKQKLALAGVLVYNQSTGGYSMSARMFGSAEKAKLTQLINEGMQVMQEVETLNEGLSDTIKAIAEELEIKPATLKKAIRIAHKAKLGETNKDHEELNTILETVGKTL
jgi:DNA-binding MarR family transcriptional regulator